MTLSRNSHSTTLKKSKKQFSLLKKELFLKYCLYYYYLIYFKGTDQEKFNLKIPGCVSSGKEKTVLKNKLTLTGFCKYKYWLNSTTCQLLLSKLSKCIYFSPGPTTFLHSSPSSVSRELNSYLLHKTGKFWLAHTFVVTDVEGPEQGKCVLPPFPSCFVLSLLLIPSAWFWFPLGCEQTISSISPFNLGR